MNGLYLISGPSGSGKTTLMKETGKNKIVTMTTRPKREGEIEGVDYYFVTREEFESLLDNKQVIEYHLYENGHYYGLTKEVLTSQIKEESAYIIVEFEGMKKYKTIYPNATSVFIYAELEHVKKQLIQRGGDPTDINQRINGYVEEIQHAHLYDVLIKNEYGKFAETVEKIKQMDAMKKNA